MNLPHQLRCWLISLVTLGLWCGALIADDDGPKWTKSGKLLEPRVAHTATLLDDGRVLVTGGWNGSTEVASSELYDEDEKEFSRGPEMELARANHTATLLPNGCVLVAGGQSHGAVLDSAELFDPKTDTWIPTGHLHQARCYHTATLLPDGKVLVAGGSGSTVPAMYVQGAPSRSALDSAELYDPESGKWTKTEPLQSARFVHTATLLPNGDVLVVGGIGINGTDNVLTCAELYNPFDGTWSGAGSLGKARFYHATVLLADGRVLVIGGKPSGSTDTSASELFDPSNQKWTDTGDLAASRAGHSVTALSDGEILVVGGGNNGGVTSKSEIYYPSGGKWEQADSLNVGRFLHTSTLLLNGQVLVAGGGNALGSATYVEGSTELYGKPNSKWKVLSAFKSHGKSSGSISKEKHSGGSFLLVFAGFMMILAVFLVIATICLISLLGACLIFVLIFRSAR